MSLWPRPHENLSFEIYLNRPSDYMVHGAIISIIPRYAWWYPLAFWSPHTRVTSASFYLLVVILLHILKFQYARPNKIFLFGLIRPKPRRRPRPYSILILQCSRSQTLQRPILGLHGSMTLFGSVFHVLQNIQRKRPTATCHVQVHVCDCIAGTCDSVLYSYVWIVNRQ
jgi:hypothetical protein